MKRSNCAPTGALFITMADQREALCFACPAAQSKTSIFIESAVYSSIEALKQHSVQCHNKINDVVNKTTLETLNATMWMIWVKGGWRVDGGWRVLMESGWRVKGFDGEWMEGGGF